MADEKSIFSSNYNVQFQKGSASFHPSLCFQKELIFSYPKKLSGQNNKYYITNKYFRSCIGLPTSTWTFFTLKWPKRTFLDHLLSHLTLSTQFMNGPKMVIDESGYSFSDTQPFPHTYCAQGRVFKEHFTKLSCKQHPLVFLEMLQIR